MFENKDYETLYDNAEKITTGCLHAAVTQVESIFGAGYAAMNPRLVGKFMEIHAQTHNTLLAMKFYEGLVVSVSDNICESIDSLGDAIQHNHMSAINLLADKIKPINPVRKTTKKKV